MDSAGNRQGNPGNSYRGQYHAHPYGEFNMVVPLDPAAALNGPNGWCHAGWTAPAPGSHHYPEARGGAVIALFFLPAGRIAYHPAPHSEGAERDRRLMPAGGLRESRWYQVLSIAQIRSRLSGEPVVSRTVPDVLNAAACAPSNSNTQPWRVHVLTGAPMKELGDGS